MRESLEAREKSRVANVDQSIVFNEHRGHEVDTVHCRLMNAIAAEGEREREERTREISGLQRSHAHALRSFVSLAS